MITRNKISILATLLALLAAVPLLSACHTTAGVGEDLSAGGHDLTDSANRHTP